MRIKRISHRGDATLFNELLLRSVVSYVANNILFGCITAVSIYHRISAIHSYNMSISAEIPLHLSVFENYNINKRIIV